MRMHLQFSPLAAWLILAGAVATLFPLSLEYITAILATAAVLSIVWLPGRRLRSGPFLILYTTTATLALVVSLPLPTAWHPLPRLLLALGIWGVLLTAPLAALLTHLLRTARPHDPRQHRGQ
jgi:hypothetical protein